MEAVVDDTPVFFKPFARQVPLVLQSEAAECGLACLAMVSGYHRHHYDLATLRRRFPITMKGATLDQLIQIAGKMGFSARPLQLDLEHFTELQRPCILHWKFKHFVVLSEVRRKGIVIFDPATGEREVPWSEVDTSFTGVALELSPTASFEEKDESAHLKLSQLWTGIRGLTGSLLIVVTLSLTLQVFAIISPLYMQTVVDEVVISSDHELLRVLALGFGLLALISAATSALRSLVILLFSNQLTLQITSNLIHHLLKLPLSYFERRQMGDIVSRFRSLDYVQNQMTVGLVEAVVDGIMIIGTLVMMLVYSAKLALIVMTAVLLYLLVRMAWYRPVKLITEEQIVAKARKDSSFMETVRSMQGIRLYGRESQRESAWRNLQVDEQNAGVRQGRLQIFSRLANQSIFGLETVLVVYIGAMSVLSSELSIGMLFAFVSYKSQFSGKATTLIDRWIQFRMLRLHMDRLGDIVLTEPEEADDYLGHEEIQVDGNIAFSNLTYRHGETEPYLFQDLSVHIAAGESVAIVGSSGNGKTTLFKILLGILEPNDGDVLIDDISIRKRGLSAVRRHIGTVMQDDQLLSGSIMENITFFDEQIDLKWMEACAKFAAIDEDIQAMPMAYNTLIAEMGSSLSGGQRQRILLARALYRRPRILLMDEATSHLDIKLERVINKHLQALNITRVFIAHRPETIAYADRVLLLSNKQLIEQLP